DFSEILLRQSQAHAEHDDAQKGDDVGSDPLEGIRRIEGKDGEEKRPDGKGVADELAQASEGLHDGKSLRYEYEEFRPPLSWPRGVAGKGDAHWQIAKRKAASRGVGGAQGGWY